MFKIGMIILNPIVDWFSSNQFLSLHFTRNLSMQPLCGQTFHAFCHDDPEGQTIYKGEWLMLNINSWGIHQKNVYIKGATSNVRSKCGGRTVTPSDITATLIYANPATSVQAG
jgi:hypothetical protein